MIERSKNSYDFNCSINVGTYIFLTQDIDGVLCINKDVNEFALNYK